MMKNKILLVLVGILILMITGCAAMTPVHPVKSESDYYIDKKYCDKKARKYSTQGRDDDFSIIDEINLSHRCMSEKGWTYKREK